jgi:predicted nucleic acid-binding protein
VIVVDASAVIEVLLNTPGGVRAVDRLFADGETLHAPHLLDLEVAQVLRRYALAAELDAARGAQALEDLAALPLNRYPDDVLLPRIWELRHNVTAYDAAYVALADALAAPLVTRDAALAASRGHAARIELL